MKLKPIDKAVLFFSVYAFFAVILKFFRFETDGIAVNFSAAPEIFGSLFLILGISSVFHFLVNKFYAKKSYADTMISGLILFLVINYTFGAGQYFNIILATLLTMSSRFFLRFRNLPVFNPVAFGIVATFLIAKIIPALPNPFVSWWGASYQIHLPGEAVVYHISLALFFILIWVFFGLNKWRKYSILISFLVGHLLFQGLLLAIGNTTFDAVKAIFTDATIYFFAAVMLIEPRTSPLVKKQQITYGLIAVVVLNVLILLKDLTGISVSISYLVAILAANFYFFLAKRKLLKK